MCIHESEFSKGFPLFSGMLVYQIDIFRFSATAVLCS